MAHIKITKGLDIPIKGAPGGLAHPLIPSGEVSQLTTPSHIALNFNAFEELSFKLHCQVGDSVRIGEPLAEDRASPGRMFCSPAAGTISEIKRGLKRRLLAIVIAVSPKEEYHPFPPLNLQSASREELLSLLKEAGLFASIRSRPFNRLASPSENPKQIFVKAIESAPFVPPSEYQVIGFEREFQEGLRALTKLTTGEVHLVYRQGSHLRAFTQAEGVQKHTAEGPHPVGNASVHIQYIDPIRSPEDVIWTIKARDVVAIGHLLLSGRSFTSRIISIAGPGILSEKVGYFKARAGFPVSALISGRVPKGHMRFISGDPLMGHKVEVEDFLGFDDETFCVIPENREREFLHFFRLGKDKYTFSKTYLSGHLSHRERRFDFTTNQHGEHRAFIDPTLYDKVMPLPISTMSLVKAVMAEDFDLAEQLGLLGVDSEDFALPTFVCPSKIEMTEIIKNGLKQYAKEFSS